MQFNKAAFFPPDILAAVAKQQDGDFWQFQLATKDKSILLVLSYDELVAFHKLLSDAVISQLEDEPEDKPQVRIYEQIKELDNKHLAEIPCTDCIRNTIEWLHNAYPKNKQVQIDLLASKLSISIYSSKELVKQNTWRDKIIAELNKLV